MKKGQKAKRTKKVTEALKPSHFIANMPSIQKDQKAKKKGASAEERHYYAMTRMAGWRQFRTLTDELLEDLDNTGNLALESGMSYSDIGRNTVAVNLAKGIIRGLIEKVEDAKEACEQPDVKK